MTSNSRQLDEILAHLVEEYTSAIDDGQTVDIEDLATRHPEFADEIRRTLRVLQELENLEGDENSGPIDPTQQRKQIGDFQIVREIGRGGMGIVYEAIQLSVDRRVALKVLPFAALADSIQLQRFKNEIRAAGTLHHANIVPIFSVGLERGMHFFAMQYIDGPSLEDVLFDLKQPDDRVEASRTSRENEEDRRSVSAQQSMDLIHETSSAGGGTQSRKEIGRSVSTRRSTARREYIRSVAEWGIQVADGLAYAHENGIVHRDIKPGNLLLDDRNRIWIADFGLARIEREASMTLTGDVVGTLRYMAPEQALAKRVLIDHRADIYSLGATMYELLTLQPVFEGGDRQDLLKKLAFEQPVPLIQIDHGIPRDLNTIVLRTLEKNPIDRYESAKDLSDDLRRFLDDRPIHARRPGPFTRLAKWTRRHRSLVATIAVGLMVTIVTVFVVLLRSNRLSELSAQRLADANTELADSERELQIALYYSDLQQAYQAFEDGRLSEARRLLDAQTPSDGHRDMRDFAWRYLQHRLQNDYRIVYRRNREPIHDISISPDESQLALVTSEKLRLLRYPTGQLIQSVSLERQGRTGVAFSHDGESLLYGSHDGPVVKVIKRRIADSKVNKLHTSLGGPPISSVQVLSRGGLLVGARFSQIHLFQNGMHHVFENNRNSHTQLPISEDQSRFAAFFGKGTGAHVNGIRVWDLGEAKLIHEFGTEERPKAVCWMDDDQNLAAGYRDSKIEIRNARSGELLDTFSVPNSQISIMVARHGRIACGCDDGMVFVLDTETEETKKAFLHQTEVSSLMWSQQGNLICSSLDGSIVELAREYFDSSGVGSGWRRFEFQRDNESRVDLKSQSIFGFPVVAGGRLNLSKSAAFLQRDLADPSRMISIDQRRGFALETESQRTQVYDLFERIEVAEANQIIESAAFANRNLIFGFDDRTLRLMDPTTLEEGCRQTFLDDVESVHYDSNGGVIYAGGRFETIQVLDAGSLEVLDQLPAGGTKAICSSERLGTLVTAHRDGGIRVWDAETRSLVRLLRGHSGQVFSLALHPDGRTLASAGIDGTVRLWNLNRLFQIGILVHTPRDLEASSVVFSDDGSSIGIIAVTRPDTPDREFAFSITLPELPELATISPETGY